MYHNVWPLNFLNRRIRPISPNHLRIKIAYMQSQHSLGGLWVWGQPGLHNETLPQTNNNKKMSTNHKCWVLSSVPGTNGGSIGMSCC
jgi:hypothetical protein